MSDYESSLPIRTEADVDERLQSKIIDFTDPSLGMEVDAEKDAHVKAKLRDGNGDAFGIETNPFFVVATDNPQPEIHDYDKAVSVANGTPVSHSYSPVNGAKVAGLILSASGKAKFEISFGVTGSEVETYVAFNSTSNPTFELVFPKPISLAATDSIKVTKSNLDKQDQDIYSTINGEETD